MIYALYHNETYSGRPSYMSHERLEVLKNIVLDQPDKTLMEYC